MKFLPQLCLVGVVAAGLALATPANAQKIRTYGDQSSGSSSDGGGGGSSAGSAGGAGWYPGMPQPSSGNQGGQASQQQGGQQGKEGEGGDEVTGSFRVRMYGGSSPTSASGPRTTLDMTIENMYRGVIPGKRDEVEHLNKERDEGVTTGDNRLTWLGFQPEDSRTRVFIQTSGEADYDKSMNTEDNVLTLTLYDTKLSDKNFSRFIDTSYFDRNVKRIESKETNDNVQITIQLDEVEQPTVQQAGSYLYLDFPYKSQQEKASGEQSGGQ